MAASSTTSSFSQVSSRSFGSSHGRARHHYRSRNRVIVVAHHILHGPSPCRRDLDSGSGACGASHLRDLHLHLRFQQTRLKAFPSNQQGTTIALSASVEPKSAEESINLGLEIFKDKAAPLKTRAAKALSSWRKPSSVSYYNNL